MICKSSPFVSALRSHWGCVGDMVFFLFHWPWLNHVSNRVSVGQLVMMLTSYLYRCFTIEFL